MRFDPYEIYSPNSLMHSASKVVCLKPQSVKLPDECSAREGYLDDALESDCQVIHPI